MLSFAMSSKIETTSTLQHLYIIEVLMHVKAQQSCCILYPVSSGGEK